jgi:hypothetical protein
MFPGGVRGVKSSLFQLLTRATPTFEPTRSVVLSEAKDLLVLGMGKRTFPTNPRKDFKSFMGGV